MLKSGLLVLLLGILSGTTLLGSRFSVGQYSASNYLTLRFLIASIAYAVLIWLMPREKLGLFKNSKKFWVGSIFVGLLTGISLNAIIMAMQYISSGINSILLTIGPALTVIMAHFLLENERLSIKTVVGVIIALFGIVLMIVFGESGLPEIDQVNNLGYIFSLGGILIGSYSAVYLRKNLFEFDTVQVASVRNFIALVVSTLLSIFIFGFDLSMVDSTGYLVLIYAAIVGTFVAHLLNVYVNQKFGATTISMTTYIIPIVTNIGGVILLGEQITFVMIVGMIFVITGIIVMNHVFKYHEKVSV